MQIKQFYLDLKEWPQYAKKNKNVWLLEEEAFRDPLKFVFEFDDSDNLKLSETAKECMQRVLEMKQIERNVNEKIQKMEERYKSITKSYQEIESLIEKSKELEERIEKRNNEYKKVLSEFADSILKQDNKLAKIQEVVAQPKELKVYHYTTETLVTWDDIHYWLSFTLPSWKYAIIEKKQFTPQNEYVLLDRVNPLDFKIQFVEKEYTPEVQIRSSNWIDKPVCKVEFDILFFQI